MKSSAQSPGAKILFFESHPVQYKAPVYQALQTILPDAFEVVYASDASIRAGNIDQGFGSEVVWDVPLMDGYANRVLNNEHGTPFTTPGSLTGRGIFPLLRRERPRAVVLTHFRYRFDQTAFLSALLLRIPILIRQETQDELYAGKRPLMKSAVRALIYRALYAPCRHAFAFGELNYRHLLRHGVSEDRITFARFSVPDPFAELMPTERAGRRADLRQKLNISDGGLAVCFFGKFIPKKSPQLIFASLAYLPASVLSRLHLVFVGSGELQAQLQMLAAGARSKFGVPTTFTGFVNQSQLPDYYLAADIAVLPSSYEETWGLVVNEALNAGCGAVVTRAVGCQLEFAMLERVRVVETGNASELAAGIVELAGYIRDFDWASQYMAAYSSQAAAAGIAAGIHKFLK
jgi:glycosyltransferase involved in cell wall biosynthesis